MGRQAQDAIGLRKKQSQKKTGCPSAGLGIKSLFYFFGKHLCL